MTNYDDVLIKPINSTVVSSAIVSTTYPLSDSRKPLSLPLMARIGGQHSIDVCNVMSQTGIIGILENLEQIQGDTDGTLKILKSLDLWGLPVRPSDNSKDTLKAMELNPAIIEIRSGHGYSFETLKLTEEIKNRSLASGLDSLVMYGNVLTIEGANALKSAGADIIRVGNPSGEYFNSKLMGTESITAIQDCWSADAIIVAEESQLSIDYLIKALVAGADLYLIKYLSLDILKDYKVDIEVLVENYIHYLQTFCMDMNATTLDAMRNNSELILK